VSASVNPYLRLNGSSPPHNLINNSHSLSQSEIEMMNYTLSPPPAVVIQLTQRIIYLQGAFKTMDFLNHKKL